MGKFGSKKTRISGTTESHNSKKEKKSTELNKLNISTRLTNFSDLINEHKYKIISTAIIIILIILLIKTCGNSNRDTDYKDNINTENNEIIDPDKINEDKSEIKKKKKIIYRKKSKITSKKPKTYSKPVNGAPVKKKKIVDPNFGTTIDIVDPNSN